MSTERIDALETLMRHSSQCMREVHDLIEGFRRSREILGLRSIHDHQWRDLSRDVIRHVERIGTRAEALRNDRHLLDLIPVVEDANLSFIRPVRFREFDFLTATEAAFAIGRSIYDDCNAVTDWPERPDLDDDDKLEDCDHLIAAWEPLTDALLRDWLIQIEIECRRAIRDEYDWLDRQEAGEVPEGTLRASDKKGIRRTISRRLRKKNATGNEWARLAALVNADPEFQKLGMDPVDRNHVRNDCLGMRRKRR